MKAARLSRRRFLKVAAAHSAACLACGLLPSARGASGGAPQRVRWRGIALGAAVSIELYTDDPSHAREALAECRREIQRLEGVFSLYDEQSAVGRLNRDGFLSAAPAELRELIALARGYSELTEGAFDITIQPLCELLRARGAEATDREVAATLERIGYRGVECKGGAVRFARPGMRVTFNGIAQGYITDRVADLLKARGFGHTLVDLGEKRALGGHPSGRPWLIAVEAPGRERLAGAIELDGRALATSGGYGEVFAPGRLHHLLDARSGGSHHGFASVSVLAPRAVHADALSTCLAVMAPERAAAFFERMPAVEAHVVKQGADRLERLT